MSCRKTFTIRLATIHDINSLDDIVLHDLGPGGMFRALRRSDEAASHGSLRLTSYTKGLLPCWLHSMV